MSVKPILIPFHHQNRFSSLDLDDFVYLLHSICYLLEAYMLPYNSYWTGSDECFNTNAPEGETMSKMIKEARPVAEAAVISMAIVIAALAVPAAILYAAV